jgi:hypothetical protein
MGHGKKKTPAPGLSRATIVDLLLLRLRLVATSSADADIDPSPSAARTYCLCYQLQIELSPNSEPDLLDLPRSQRHIRHLFRALRGDWKELVVGFEGF